MESVFWIGFFTGVVTLWIVVTMVIALKIKSLGGGK